MEVLSNNAKIECRDLKKCGEIATLWSFEKQEFFLNCGFCEYTFLQLENFIRHIYEDHILEFSQLELKQEEDDTKEFLDEDAGLQKENRDNDFVFKDFERVEIELDTKRLDRSSEAKDNITDEFLVEELLDNTKTEEPDDYEFLEKIAETRRAPKTTPNRQQTNKKTCEWNETEQSNNYEDDEDSYLDNDDTECSLKGDTQATSKSAIKKATGTTIPRSSLEDAQYQLLAENYKNYTCLWDENDIAYRFKNRRDEALKSLHEEFKENTGLDLTLHDLEYEITRLRRFCSMEKKQKILCKRKKRSYQPSCTYYKSIVYLEVDVPPFECSECGKLLPGLGQYKVHLASHDGSLPFKCHLCGHGFQLASNLTVHLRRHVHDYTYKCEVCDKPCATTTEIKIHMRSHTGEKPFVCSICGQRFRTSSHLLVHMMRHQKRPRHKCKLCPKTFYETGTLHEHMAVHRNIRDQICSVCNKGFISGKQLRQHQLIHNAEKKYSCKLCGRRFAQFAGLSGHMKSHGTKLSATVPGRNT